MKLISLNIWAGKEFDNLIQFISSQAEDTDMFCFQEVFDTPTGIENIDEYYRANLFDELAKSLPNHMGYFAPAQEGHGFNGPVDFPIAWGLAMFIKKSIEIKDIGEIFIKGFKNSKGIDNTTIPRNLQYAIVLDNEIEYNITHFHGLWNGKGKTDTDERIEQSKKIKEFLKDKKRIVLCGDFNLLPDTESLKILEDGLINLIKLKDIKSTRSKLYEKPDKFADYTLISKDINIDNFKVPEVEVSDHLPMILNFS